jgi:DNA-binding NtrC family response regulator
MEVTIIVIEDRNEFKEHAIIYSLEDTYKNVEFFSTSKKGLEYITGNLDKNLIVLLDIQFPEGQQDGHEVLAEIRKISKLIPVILWSGVNEDTESFSDFINNHAFGFLSKGATIAEALPMVAKAVLYLEMSLDNTIEDWLIKKEGDKDKPIYISTDGRSYSLNDIIREIRQQTPVGKDFSKKLNSLTIDLLLRKKENLNG